MKMKICHCHPVTKVWFYSICAGLWNCTPSPDVWQGDVIRNHKRELTSCMLVLVSLLAAVDNTCAPLSAVWSSWRIQSSPHSRCHTPGCRRWHCEHLCSANPATPTIRKQSGKKSNQIDVQDDLENLWLCYSQDGTENRLIYLNNYWCGTHIHSVIWTSDRIKERENIKELGKKRSAKGQKWENKCSPEGVLDEKSSSGSMDEETGCQHNLKGKTHSANERLETQTVRKCM